MFNGDLCKFLPRKLSSGPDEHAQHFRCSLLSVLSVIPSYLSFRVKSVLLECESSVVAFVRVPKCNCYVFQILFPTKKIIKIEPENSDIVNPHHSQCAIQLVESKINLPPVSKSS